MAQLLGMAGLLLVPLGLLWLIHELSKRAKSSKTLRIIKARIALPWLP